MNLASVPDWAWIALAIAAALYLHRQGILDGILKRPASPPVPPQPPSYTYLPVTHAVPSQPPLITEPPQAGPTILEKVTLRGSARITVSGGRIDVES